MLRRLVFTLLWGAGLFFLSTFLMFGVFGDYFQVQSPNGEVFYQWNASWKYVHMGVGALGLLLGLFGWLPGTRPSKHKV